MSSHPGDDDHSGQPNTHAMNNDTTVPCGSEFTPVNSPAKQTPKGSKRKAVAFKVEPGEDAGPESPTKKGKLSPVKKDGKVRSRMESDAMQMIFKLHTYPDLAHNLKKQR